MIKLDDIICDGRVDGTGEPDPTGSYLSITCIQYSGKHDEPDQRLSFGFSEGMAEELIASIEQAIQKAAGHG